MSTKLERVITAEASLLSFRMSRQGFLELGRSHLLFGLVITWILLESADTGMILELRSCKILGLALLSTYFFSRCSSGW